MKLHGETRHALLQPPFGPDPSPLGWTRPPLCVIGWALDLHAESAYACWLKGGGPSPPPWIITLNLTKLLVCVFQLVPQLCT